HPPEIHPYQRGRQQQRPHTKHHGHHRHRRLPSEQMLGRDGIDGIGRAGAESERHPALSTCSRPPPATNNPPPATAEPVAASQRRLSASPRSSPSIPA